jgi:hypothetical protein
MTDNEYPITVCDLAASTVTVGITTWPFAEFVSLSDQEILRAYREGERP